VVGEDERRGRKWQRLDKAYWYRFFFSLLDEQERGGREGELLNLA
jgi:hypothetical protein